MSIYGIDFSKINFRKRPDLYRIGRGEQWVLSAEPYKSEILPYWKFKTPELAKKSVRKIYSLFKNYLQDSDFVGADMARKYLQMGYTRSMRYSNHKSGKKYDGPVPKDKKGLSGSHGREELPRDRDWQKYKSASYFLKYYLKAKDNKKYRKLKQLHWNKYETN